MKDSKTNFCDYSSNKNFLNFTDSCDQQNQDSVPLHRRSVKWLSERRFVKWLLNIKDWLFSTTSIENEKKFLHIQMLLKNHEDTEFKEAEYMLNIIDHKAQSLLAYISISIAALVFLIPVIETNSLTNSTFFVSTFFTSFIFLLLVVLSIAMFSCLSCVNVVAARTVLRFYPENDKKNCEKYRELILSETTKRHNKYLIAQCLSRFTAVCLILIFLGMLIVSMQ